MGLWDDEHKALGVGYITSTCRQSGMEGLLVDCFSENGAHSLGIKYC